MTAEHEEVGRPAPPRALHRLPPAHRIEIYSRDDDRRVCFVSDAARVPGAKRIDVAHLDRQDEADAIARKCADILEIAGMGADGDGWHTLPPDCRPGQFLATLLRTARNAVWAEQAPAVGLEPDDAALPPLALRGALAELFGAGKAEPASSVPEPAPVETCVIIPLPEKPRRTRAARTWTRERDITLTEMVLTGYSAKDIAADPRFRGVVSENAIYQEASRRGLSFRTSPQITIRGLPASVLAVYDRAATACHKSRDRLVADWMMKAASDPDRYGLTAV